MGSAMTFTVYRRDVDDRSRYVASCVYLDDAKTILDRWKAGMILDDEGRTILVRREFDEYLSSLPHDDDRGACGD